VRQRDGISRDDIHPETSNWVASARSLSKLESATMDSMTRFFLST
jgi:hypothetical protein